MQVAQSISCIISCGAASILTSSSTNHMVNMRQETNSQKMFDGHENHIHSLLFRGGDAMVKSGTHVVETFSQVTSELVLDRTVDQTVAKDVMEIKGLLLNIMRLLQKDEHTSKIEEEEVTSIQEGEKLKHQIFILQEKVKLRDKRIEDLENIIESKKRNFTTQTNVQRLHKKHLSSPKSLHNISEVSFKPCHHEWGPCANDHSNHHSRSGVEQRHRGKSSQSASTPWENSTSASMGNLSCGKRKIPRSTRYSRASSLDILNEPSRTPQEKSIKSITRSSLYERTKQKL